jgi:hypothetical protein
MLSFLSIGSMRLAGRQNLTDFRPKTAISLHRCAMIEKAFSDTTRDFARISAVCPARASTIPTIHSASLQQLKIEQKHGTSLDKLVLSRRKSASRLRTVQRLSVPVIYFGYQDSYSRNSPIQVCLIIS